MEYLCTVEDQNKDTITLFVSYPASWIENHKDEAFEKLIEKTYGFLAKEKICLTDRRFVFCNTKTPTAHYATGLWYHFNETIRSIEKLYAYTGEEIVENTKPKTFVI